MKQLFLFLFLCLTYSLAAQNPIFNQAEKHFNNYEYQEAITLYENIITEDSSNFKVQERLADTFRRINQYQKAAYWFSKIVNREKVRPIYFLYYGQVLLAQGDCGAANYWNQKYLDEYPEEIYSFRVHPIDCDRFALTRQSQEDTTIFFIKKLPIINTNGDEFGVNYYNNTILFTRKSELIPPPRYDSWYASPYKYISCQLSIDTIDLARNLFDYRSEPIQWKPLPTTSLKYNDSNLCVTKDGKKVYFVRHQEWIDEDTTVLRHKVFYTFQKDNQKKATLGLPFNSDEYSVRSPYWVKEDSILYFASNMPGGFGGYDLYYSRLEDGMFSPPINLGPSVNTEFDEINPFLNAANQRLYFASNNDSSLGGYDIFYSKIDENAYSKYIHLSAPINSKVDDLNFICNQNGTHGYFASDRMGEEFKLDIYEFVKK